MIEGPIKNAVAAKVSRAMQESTCRGNHWENALSPWNLSRYFSFFLRQHGLEGRNKRTGGKKRLGHESPRKQRP